eukprot:4176396-Prymnesium_polylepis.1
MRHLEDVGEAELKAYGRYARRERRGAKASKKSAFVRLGLQEPDLEADACCPAPADPDSGAGTRSTRGRARRLRRDYYQCQKLVMCVRGMLGICALTCIIAASIIATANYDQLELLTAQLELDGEASSATSKAQGPSSSPPEQHAASANSMQSPLSAQQLAPLLTPASAAHMRSQHDE